MKLITSLLFLLLLLGCSSELQDERKEVIFHTENNKIAVKVEIPLTSAEKAQGLMHRTELGEFEGMLFPFDTDKKHKFWMKNTLIPLDMIHLSNEGVVVDIIRADPCVEDPCTIYEPIAESRYVLEVNQNFSTRHDIVLGQQLTLPSLSP